MIVGIDSDVPAAESQVLYLWEQVSAAAPEEDRLGWLAAQTGMAFRELDWARRVRNRIAHPDGAAQLDAERACAQERERPRGGFVRGRTAVFRLLSTADPLFARLESIRGPMRVGVPIAVGLFVLWIAVAGLGGVSVLDEPMTYLWLVIVLMLIALAMVFLPEVMGLLLVVSFIYSLVSGNWLGFLEVCVGAVVVAFLSGLVCWLYDL